VLRNAVLVAVAIAVAPVTLVAAGAAGYAWWRGWTPRRLYQGAGWCLPMAAAWLVAVVVWPARVVAPVMPGGAAVAGRGTGLAGGTDPGGGYPPRVGPGAVWFRLVAAPFRAWAGMWQLVGHGQAGGAVVAVAPVAVMRRGGRAHPGRARRVRPAPVAASGQVRPGADRRARLAAAAVG
jgi:hypothetical protein